MFRGGDDRSRHCPVFVFASLRRSLWKKLFLSCFNRARGKFLSFLRPMGQLKNSSFIGSIGRQVFMFFRGVGFATLFKLRVLWVGLMLFDVEN